MRCSRIRGKCGSRTRQRTSEAARPMETALRPEWSRAGYCHRTHRNPWMWTTRQVIAIHQVYWRGELVWRELAVSVVPSDVSSCDVGSSDPANRMPHID